MACLILPASMLDMCRYIDHCCCRISRLSSPSREAVLSLLSISTDLCSEVDNVVLGAYSYYRVITLRTDARETLQDSGIPSR